VVLVSGLESFWISYWWVFLLILMFLCCIRLRGRRGSGMCGFRSWRTDTRDIHPTDSAIDILDKRYALGEISREEYEERKRTIGQGRA
jgi:putative membrane protein